MRWFQNTIRLSPFRRGFHIITREIENALPEIQDIQVGLAHIFIHHTSASLTINENAKLVTKGYALHNSANPKKIEILML